MKIDCFWTPTTSLFSNVLLTLGSHAPCLWSCLCLLFVGPAFLAAGLPLGYIPPPPPINVPAATSTQHVLDYDATISLP